MSNLDRIADARAKAFADTPARSRLAMLFDPDTFVEVDGFVAVDGAPSGVVCGFGAVKGSPAYAFAQDASENGGAVGRAHAAKIRKIFDLALKTGAPVVGIYDSMGARISEGAGALNAYGDMLLAVNNLSGVVPQLSVVLGTCAGSSALMACCADFVIMSKKAEFFVTQPEKGRESAGSAADAALSGVAHIVRDDEESSIKAARDIISMMPLNNLAAPPVLNYAEDAQAPEALRAACADIEGASARDIVSGVCDTGSVIELFSDFGKNVYAGMGTLGGFACGVIATAGKTLCADCCNKIAKLVSVWDAFQIPVLTFVNTAGLESGADSGAVRDMAKLAHVYAEATTAKMAVITGKAYGSAYVALASKAAASDYTVAWPSAVISALAPKTAVAFSYADRITADKSREAVEADYIENEASPFTAAAGGHIDDVIDPAVTRPALIAAMDLLSAKRVHKNPKKHGNIPF
ncbi:MAG: carboxyl transferase [Oscillospiraceae bacterium]|jgi:acetyl-CoA carboxylase carboxyltransferase component|nr:carboxyl transferase [Oscillospiraceae bacterium]